MPQAYARPAKLPRRAFAAQTAILAVVIAACTLAPRAGQAAIYLPIIPVLNKKQHQPALDWALAHGASIMGTGPAGGLILGEAPAGLMLRAAAEGTLVLAVPAFLCRQPESRNHG